MDYNLMFRWFVGLGIDDAIRIPTVFTKNRDRRLTTAMARKVMAAILAHREVAPLLSDEHFSVDGTLIKAWASLKCFQPKAEGNPPGADGPGDPPARTPDADDSTEDPESEAETAPMPSPFRCHRNAEVDFRGQKRSNATHASTTDPDARLFRKVRRVSRRSSGPSARRTGTGAVLCYRGQALMEKARHSAIDGRTTRHPIALSQKCRKKIEEPFGWAKTVGGPRALPVQG